MAAGVEIGDRAGVAIRRRMRELGLSQPDLGRALGRSYSWVNMYLLERPVYTLRRMWVQNPDLIARLLKALQWTPEEFTREIGIQLPGAGIPGSIPVVRYRIPVIDAGAGPPMCDLHENPCAPRQVASGIGTDWHVGVLSGWRSATALLQAHGLVQPHLGEV